MTKSSISKQFDRQNDSRFLGVVLFKILMSLLR